MTPGVAIRTVGFDCVTVVVKGLKYIGIKKTSRLRPRGEPNVFTTE